MKANTYCRICGGPRNGRSQEIMEMALERYGREAQEDMAIEEMGELIVAIMHLRRERIAVRELAEEIADVEIMLMQLKTAHDIHELVEQIKDIKIDRLEKRLEQRRLEK